jgi:hypothetical protein
MITEIDPGADPRLAALLAAASAPAELPLAGEPEALTAYRRFQDRPRFAGLLGHRPVRVVAAALFGGVLLAGGVATAATGSLPVVGHQHHAAPAVTSVSDGGRTGTRDSGTGTDPGSTGADDAAHAGPGAVGHPAAEPTLGGVAKGAATCTAASHGTCRAGQHGRASIAHHHHGSTHPARTHAHAHGGTDHAHGGTGRRPGFVGLPGTHGTKHRIG